MLGHPTIKIVNLPAIHQGKDQRVIAECFGNQKKIVGVQVENAKKPKSAKNDWRIRKKTTLSVLNRLHIKGSTMKSTNFEFLREKRPELAELGGFAEYHARNDPSACLHKLRLLVERMTKIVYDQYRLVTLPRSSFNDLLIDDSFKRILPNAILDKMHALRIRGNDAVHGGKFTAIFPVFSSKKPSKFHPGSTSASMMEKRTTFQISYPLKNLNPNHKK